MSRNIDLTKPLNAEDRAYLESRGQRAKIIVNERQFGNKVASPEEAQKVRRAQLRGETVEEVESEDQGEPEGEATAEGAEYDPADVEYVNSLKKPELQAELEERDMDTSGNVSELRERLLESLAQDDEPV